MRDRPQNNLIPIGFQLGQQSDRDGELPVSPTMFNSSVWYAVNKNSNTQFCIKSKEFRQFWFELKTQFLKIRTLCDISQTLVYKLFIFKYSLKVALISRELKEY